MWALIYADLLATSVLPVQEINPFVLETHTHHYLSGNENRQIRLLWLTVHHLRNYQHNPQKMDETDDMKQILKQDPCFSLWSSSGPSKAMFIVTFTKKKSYSPPRIFAFYLYKETYPESSKTALERSLALYRTFRQKGKMFKCYPVDWSSPRWPPNRQFLLKLDRTGTENEEHY